VRKLVTNRGELQKRSSEILQGPAHRFGAVAAFEHALEAREPNVREPKTVVEISGGHRS
jgi:hypothetical protein